MFPQIAHPDLEKLEDLIEDVQMEIDTCLKDVANASLKDGQAHPREIACFGTCITMMQDREAELDQSAAKKAARRARKRAAQTLHAAKDKGKVKSDRGRGKAIMKH